MRRRSPAFHPGPARRPRRPPRRWRGSTPAWGGWKRRFRRWTRSSRRMAGPASGLSEAAAKIVAAAGKFTKAAEAVAGIERTTGEAARFTSDTKAAAHVLQTEAGKQVAVLKEAGRDLDRAVAALGSREEGSEGPRGCAGQGHRGAPRRLEEHERMLQGGCLGGREARQQLQGVDGRGGGPPPGNGRLVEGPAGRRRPDGEERHPEPGRATGHLAEDPRQRGELQGRERELPEALRGGRREGAGGASGASGRRCGAGRCRRCRRRWPRPCCRFR